MGGIDKPMLMLAGRTLLDHVLSRVAPQAAPIALNANGEPARWARWGLPILPDPIAGHPGPLAGVLAAMLWARAACPAAIRVLTAPGDTPFLPEDLVARLGAASGEITVARSGGRTHPVVALWPVALAASLAEALARGERRVGDWAAAHGAVAVEFEDAPFWNVNTPEDLLAAESRS